MEQKNWKCLYFDVLKQNQELRSETQQVSAHLSLCLKENTKLKQQISQLQDELSTYQSSLGQSKGSLSPLQVLLSSKHSVRRRERIFENFFVIRRDEAIAYQFPSTSNFNTQVLPSFAFPSAVNTTTSSLNRTNTFVFTMKSNESLPAQVNSLMPNADRDLLYCCCVQSYDDCYCLVSFHPCFALHFAVLFAYIRLSGNDEEQLGLLEEFCENCELQEGSINLQSIPSIDWSNSELSMLDCEWTCPAIFALLDFDGFFRLLCAVMQEQSVVFVSKNLDNLTSCVLGITALMRPFKWQHLLCPAIPDTLIDVVDADVPLIIGTVAKPNTQLILVNLDEKQIHTRVPSFHVIQHLELKDALRGLYQEWEIHSLVACIRQFWAQIIEGQDTQNEFVAAVRQTQFFNFYMRNS